MRELERRRAEAEGRAPGHRDPRTTTPGRPTTRTTTATTRTATSTTPRRRADDDDAAPRTTSRPRSGRARGAAARRSRPAGGAGARHAAAEAPASGRRPRRRRRGRRASGSILRRVGLAAIGIVDPRDRLLLSRVGHRPLDRRHLVPERRLRQRVLDAPRGPGRAVRGRGLASRWSCSSATSGSPAACRRPPIPSGPGRLKTVDGPARRRPAPGRAQRPARRRPAGRSEQPARGRPAPTFVFDAEDMPDLVPLGTWAIALFAVLLALGVAGAVPGAWETLLLWINRVPFSPTPTVADPVFGRDIGFFLFELPFFRFVQSLVNGLLLASLVVAGARYLLATTARRRGVRHPGPRPPRGARRAVPAVGRVRLPARQVRARLQPGGRRDGRRVRRRERAVPGLRRPDVPVGARGGPADRRRLHPLDVAAGRRSSSSGSRPRSCSAASTRRRSSASASTPTRTPRRSSTSRTTSR